LTVTAHCSLIKGGTGRSHSTRTDLAMDYNRNLPIRQEASFDTASKNGGSLFSVRTGGRRKKDPVDEAMLLSKATSQAMIAARSIVLSGGSQQTALSTAKAAAQSILAPHISDNDSVVTAGQSFLGRRKGKRQAEIVASMALLSVNNSLQQFKQNSTAPQQWDASMLVQTPPAQVVPMQHDMLMAMDDESLTVASLLAERQESFRKMSLGLKYNQHMQRESSAMPTAYREVAGRDQPETRQGRDTRLIESPRGKGRSAVPEKNQSERSRAKDVPVEPIYISNVPDRKMKRIPVPLSYSTSGEDESTAAGDFETTASYADTADPLTGAKRPDKGFLQQNVDPLLFSITSAFNCGFSPSSTIAAAKDQKKGRRQFGDDDDEEDGDSDDDINETRDDEQQGVVTDVVMLKRAGDSESSVESAQIIRELNDNTDSPNAREGRYTRKKEKARIAAKKATERRIAATSSVEDVVLRALSVRDHKKIPSRQPIEELRNDPIARSRNNRNDEFFAGVHSNPEMSSLRVVAGAPGDQAYQTSEKPTPSRKSLLHNFMRNRTRKGREAETNAETAE
jgi:hypothetical protein